MQRRVPPQFACIDLFCGCGGNSWGMLREGSGPPLTPLLALDIEPSALATYHWNMPLVDILRGDVRDVTAETLLDRIGLRPGELGCLVASPPCQTYSRNYRRPRDASDYRNTLYAHILRIVDGIQPWTILVENVPEMEQHSEGKYHRDFIEHLDKYGYRAACWPVDAANYGVPQHRTRLIYMAYRKDMLTDPHLPPETHGDDPGLKPWVTVEDAIADLPPLDSGDGTDFCPVNLGATDYASEYARARLTYHNPVVFNHAARKLSATQLMRLLAVEEGQGYDDLPDDLRPASGFKASYGRLWRSKPAPTLTAFLAYPGCGRFSHYEQSRTITIREALRLQSFDDGFRVFGSLIEQSAQVGNAVPPLMAAAFRSVIVADLEEQFGTSAVISGAEWRRQWEFGPLESDRDWTHEPILSPRLYGVLRSQLRTWWTKHGRQFPWRRQADSYYVMVAVFLLQRTDVLKAERAFKEIIAAYPTLIELSSAPLEQLRTIYSSIGYQKRADVLVGAAQMVVAAHNGDVPQSIGDLKRLPGIGDFGAHAIACFAFGERLPVVDTQIARVLKRLLGFRTSKGAWEDDVTWRIGGGFVDSTFPAEHNYALIDLAALVCLPSTPCCWECPLSHWCAYANSRDGVPAQPATVSLTESADKIS